MAEAQIQTINYRHEALVDWMISRPDGTMREAAADLAMSEHQISIVRNSDAFRDYYSRRMRDHQTRVSEGIVELTQGVARESLEAIQEKIKNERAKLKLESLTDAAEMSLKALGFGRPAGGHNHTQNNFMFANVSPEMLAEARKKMQEQRSTPPLLESSAEDSPEIPPIAEHSSLSPTSDLSECTTLSEPPVE